MKKSDLNRLGNFTQGVREVVPDFTCGGTTFKLRTQQLEGNPPMIWEQRL
jgi:hypothetical protein